VPFGVTSPRPGAEEIENSFVSVLSLVHWTSTGSGKLGSGILTIQLSFDVRHPPKSFVKYDSHPTPSDTSGGNDDFHFLTNTTLKPYRILNPTHILYSRQGGKTGTRMIHVAYRKESVSSRNSQLHHAGPSCPTMTRGAALHIPPRGFWRTYVVGHAFRPARF
jgi:hypothetical protein